jgi:hypothetical protein
MSGWDPDALAAIAASDDLHVAPFRDDGVTPGTLTWIWSVVVGDDLVVRAWNGADSRWYRAAMRQHAGVITAAGQRFDVRFEDGNGLDTAAVDAAYRGKYAGSPYLPPMVDTRPQAATVRIIPREVDA